MDILKSGYELSEICVRGKLLPYPTKAILLPLTTHRQPSNKWPAK